MEQVKCPKCMTPQNSDVGECRVCGSPVNKASRRSDSNLGASARNSDASARNSDAGSHTILYPVSTRKFFIMNVTTFSLYTMFWAYKNWSMLKYEHGRRVLPAARAFFLVLFSFSLAKQIKLVGAEIGAPLATYNPTTVCVSFIILNAIAKAPDPVGLLTIFAFLAFNPVNNYLMAINKAEGLEHLIASNSKFTITNKVFIGIGSLLLLADICSMIF